MCISVPFYGLFVLTSLSSLLLVIEVASGEYGDLNSVLFEAVQGGLCSEEGKKNSRDKSDSSCPSQCHSVSDTYPLMQHMHCCVLCLQMLIRNLQPGAEKTQKASDFTNLMEFLSYCPISKKVGNVTRTPQQRSISFKTCAFI